MHLPFPTDPNMSHNPGVLRISNINSRFAAHESQGSASEHQAPKRFVLGHRRRQDALWLLLEVEDEP